MNWNEDEAMIHIPMPLSEDEDEDEYQRQLGELRQQSLEQDDQAWRHGFYTGCVLCVVAFTLLLLIPRCIQWG